MITPLHLRRLRQIWRSAGWPCQDLIEVELLAAGLVERLLEDGGRERLRLSEAGLQALAASRQRLRHRRDAHEGLVERVVIEMQRAGRLAWRGLALRAALPREDAPDRPRWVQAMPDVYSLRHTSVPAYLDVAIHEIKVSRPDLLAELRRPAKSAAYQALCGQCWFVLKRGIAEPEEIPEAFGVLLADENRLELARPAPRRIHQPDFATWMTLARLGCEPGGDEEAQRQLGEPVEDAPDQPPPGMPGP